MRKSTQSSIVWFGLVFCYLFFVFSPLTVLADEYKDAKKAYERGQNDDALGLLMIKLRKDNDHKKAIKLFKTVINLVIDSHVRAAEDYEARQDWSKALSEYDRLIKIKSDIDSINPVEKVKVNGKKVKRRIGMPEIDVDGQRTDALNSAAKQYYLKGEEFFEAAQYLQAIEEYKTALNFIKRYEDSNEKIAESYYRIAADLETEGRYREAAENYQNASAIIQKYKDTQQRAANLYYHLGSFFLSSDNCRKAYDDLSLCQNIVPQYKDVNEKLSEAKHCAIVKIAFVEFDNPTGKNLAGMALGDFIFETIKTEVQLNASQFIRIVDATITANVEDVDYLISGKLNQVQETHTGLSREPASATYEFNDGQGLRDATASYTLFKDSRLLKIAGVIKVVKATTAEVLINSQISERVQDQIEYADEIRARHPLNSPTEVYVRFWDNKLEMLRNSRKELKDVDTLAREMVTSIAGQISQKILSTLDKTPYAPDPTNLDLKEPMTRQ